MPPGPWGLPLFSVLKLAAAAEAILQNFTFFSSLKLDNSLAVFLLLIFLERNLQVLHFSSFIVLRYCMIQLLQIFPFFWGGGCGGNGMSTATCSCDICYYVIVAFWGGNLCSLALVYTKKIYFPRSKSSRLDQDQDCFVKEGEQEG